MVVPLLHLPLDGTLEGQDRSGVVTAAGTGAFRYASGPWSGVDGAFLEEATANLTVNPSAETGVANLSAAGATVLTQQAAAAVVGSFGVRGATANNGSDGMYYLTPVPLNTATVRTFTGSMYIFGPAGGSVNIRLDAFYTDASATTGTVLTLTLAGTPQLVTRTVTTVNTKTLSQVRLRYYVNGAQTINVYTDAAQIEEKANATTYADGSLGTGYAWTGTAHASTSTRAASTLTIPHAPAIGSIAFMYKEQGAWTGGYQASVGAFGSNGLTAYSAGTLTFSTTRQLTLGAVMTFDRALTAGEQSKLFNASSPWGWSILDDKPGTIVYLGRPERSGVIRLGRRRG